MSNSSMRYFIDKNTSKDNDNYGKVVDFSIEDQFIRALTSKDVGLVEEMITKGVDINLKSRDNLSFLSLSSLLGCYDLVQILVINGADVADNHKNMAPLLALCCSPNKDEDELLRCMDLLLLRGADVNSCDFNRVSALSHAVKNNHEKLILKLVSKGADINMADDYGWSPVFYAVVSCNIHLLWLLLDYNANIYVLDKRGRTLVDIALEMENNDIIELLNGSHNIDKWIAQFKTKVNFSGNVFKQIIQELPSKEDRLSGFGKEIINILTSVQLSHLETEFQDHNFGFGYLLTADNAKLKSIGVHFWFERHKLINGVKKFHEYPWSTSSFTVFSPHQELDFQIASLMGTIVRQLYVISVSTFYWAKLRKGVHQDRAHLETLKDGLDVLRVSRRKLKRFQSIIKNIHRACSTIPSDLIISRVYRNSNIVKPIIWVTVLGALIYKTNLCFKIFDYLKLR